MNRYEKEASNAARRQSGGEEKLRAIEAVPPAEDAADTAELLDTMLGRAARVAIIGIGLVVGVAALLLARSILMPVVAALLIGATMRPIQLYLARYRIPRSVTALVLIAVFVGLAYLIVTLMVGSLNAWLAQSSDLGALIREKFGWVERQLSALRELQRELGGGEAAQPKFDIAGSIPAVVRDGVIFLTPALSELLVFVGTLLFFLVGTEKLRRQLITAFDTRDARMTVLRIWNDVENQLAMFVATVTVINLGVGIATAVMLWLIQFPNPLAFGVLAFVLNFIPYVGPAIVVVLLFGVGLISMPTLSGALLAPILFVVLATIEGHLITPSIMGRRLTLSPFLVFLALAFWTWLWGPLGAFIATPMLIVGLIVLGHLFPREETSLPK